jgi:NADPH:quinone reductase-like Zn-dependent oxidoreductase
MRTYRLEKLGSVEGLVGHDVDEPRLGPNDVLVRVRAMSLNRRDLQILNGTYPLKARLDVTPLSDGAGEVVAIGSAVRRFKLGDRVAGHYFAYWRDGRLSTEIGAYQLGCTLDGMLTEYAVLNEEWLVRVPAHLTWEEAATLTCAGVTAWNAINGPQAVIPGETVLTLGTGGVPLFALQFAKISGARVIATTSSEAKAQRLRELGADEVVNYRVTPDWDRPVREHTAGQGVDHVVETGGADTLQQSIAAAALYGQIALVTAVGLQKTRVEIDPPTLTGKLVTLRRIFVGTRASFEAMNRAIDLHKLRPVIDRVFPFSEAREAYLYFAERKHMGKVVIAGA